MNRVQALRQSALQFLAAEQTPEGAFLGHASLSSTDFASYRVHYTSFFTSLITSSLSVVPGSQTITARSAAFIAGQKSSEWSWNYWIRGGQDFIARPYPDDLDDTACALGALGAIDAGYIDGEALGYVANLLISQEARPGGPYRTWLVNDKAAPVWRDTDIAVNANIGFFLASQQVHLSGLEEYITQGLLEGTLESRYYLSAHPILYFIARWYRGPALPELQSMVQAALTQLSEASSSLSYALLIAAACRLGLGKDAVSFAVDTLVKQANADGYWPAAALYYEPPIDGQMYYAGSESLTTAFALEALSLHQGMRTKRTPRRSAKSPARSIVALSPFFNHLQPDLRLRYRDYVKRLTKSDVSGHITAIATLTAEACGQQVDPVTLGHLNLASVHGWIAYTIYDDILDAEGEIADLGLANLSLRRTVHHFQTALPTEPLFQQVVRESLDIIDGANTWEVVHARAVVVDGRLTMNGLPKYGNRRQLAERSWGHMLASRGVLTALGIPIYAQQQRQLRRFFRHYLIARQLNDDAHDWEADLRNGHITSVVGDLLADSYPQGPLDIDLTSDIDDLKSHFWQTTILQVAGQINRHIAQARQALRSATFLSDPTVFESWLQKLEHATSEAMSGRSEAQKFIRSFSGTPNVS